MELPARYLSLEQIAGSEEGRKAIGGAVADHDRRR
jgi:hypothetical protein